MNSRADRPESVQSYSGAHFAPRRNFDSEITYVMIDRISRLYAEEERRDRLARTEDMIHKAQNLR